MMQAAIRSRGQKTFFMVDSAEHEICSAYKSQITNNCKLFLAKHSCKLSMNIFLLINMKIPTIVDLFIFISRENFMLS